ncbi:TolC family protein [Candidatus Nitrospira neomarina]|uniref:TolC family protein n=1 Tax=Candidatus Nitrospira neomarina TaxID=3020899 RepID=A0AA96GL26_9BACT|nr:TolC family protein [Candidatus Nitrospira neomarina]WNM62350.1 TolC family protein [Candidatus Nitrospira neomarina]
MNTLQYGRAILTGIFLMLITGCLFDPQPIELKIQPPDSFSLSGQQALPDKWWEAFEDEALDRLIERALEDNPTLLATWDRLRQAEAIAVRDGAPRFPFLNGNSTASRSRTDLGTQTDRFAVGVSVAYELDLWGRVRAFGSAANFDAQASQADLTVAAITLSSQMAKTWYNLLEQRGQLALLEKQIATNEKVLQLVTLRFRQGVAAAADVLRQKQLVEQTRGKTKDVRAQIGTLSHQLAILLGKPPKSLEIPDNQALIRLPPLPSTGLPGELIQRRPDVQATFYQVQAADARVAAAIAERFPRIDLAGSITTNLTPTLTSGSFAAAPGGLFANWLATVSAQIVAPIFNAGARAAQVDLNKAARSEVLHNYEFTVLQAFQEVENALIRETQQRAKTSSLEDQFHIATQVIERLRARYLNGATAYLDVLNALNSQQELEREILTARRTLIDFRVDLAKALAGGWPMTKPEIRQLTISTG